MSPAPILDELLGDDGTGITAARRLAPLLPPEVDLLDGGTLGLLLTPLIAGRDAVLVLDAVAPSHGEPGSVVLLRDAEVRRGHGMRATAHDVSLVDALSAAELTGRAPHRFALAGMVPASLACGVGLSPTVQGRLPKLVRLACDVLRSWGVPVRDG